MSRAQKNTRRGKQSTKSAQRQPTALASGKGAGVTKRTGLERPSVVTHNPTDMADPTPRVIQTRS